MPMQVVNGAQLICTCGSLPSILTVLPIHRELDQNQFAANIMDHIPLVNIMPFGVCVKLAGFPSRSAETSATCLSARSSSPPIV